MRYLPLLLLVLAGNVSAQSVWKSDFPEYLPVFVPDLGGCEEWFTEAESIEVAEGELLRARLKNEIPPLNDRYGVVFLGITTRCAAIGMALETYLFRYWPGTQEPVFSVPTPGVVTGSMDKSRLLNALKDVIYQTVTYFLEANQ